MSAKKRVQTNISGDVEVAQHQQELIEGVLVKGEALTRPVTSTQ